MSQASVLRLLAALSLVIAPAVGMRHIRAHIKNHLRTKGCENETDPCFLELETNHDEVHLAAESAHREELPDLSGALKSPDEIAAAMFIILCSLYTTKILLMDIVGAKRSEEIRQKRDALAQTYNGIVGDMVLQLKEVRNSSAMLAELNFRGQARHFQQFMTDVARNPQKFLGVDYDGTAVLEPFRQFTRFWLKAFEQCSLQPRKEPRQIVTEKQLRSCSSIKDLTELVAKKMAATPVVFISDCSQLIEDTDKISNHQGGGRSKRTRSRAHSGRTKEGGNWFCCCCCCLCSWMRCGCSLGCGMRTNPKDGDLFPMELTILCISMKLFSWNQVLVFLAVVCGLPLGAFMFVSENTLLGIAVGTTELLLIVILYWIEEIDERGRLETQVKHLKQQHTKVEQSHRDISTKYAKMTSLVNLWQYRTEPHLDLFKDLSEQLADTPDSEKLMFLTGVTERLEKMDHALGDLWMWVGSGAFEEKKLRMIGEQLKDVAHFIMQAASGGNATKAILDRLTNVFGFLTVRVIACHGLTNKGRAIFGEVSDPYVTVRIGKDERKKFRTPTIQDNLDPRWYDDDEPPGESEFLPLSANERTLELEVWDDAKGGEDFAMGFLHVDFKAGAPGLWHKRRESLFSSRTKQVRGHGEIEYEFYYANCMWLLHTAWNHSAQARPQTKASSPGLQQLSAFLSESTL